MCSTDLTASLGVACATVSSSNVPAAMSSILTGFPETYSLEEFYTVTWAKVLLGFLVASLFKSEGFITCVLLTIYHQPGNVKSSSI